MNEEIAYLHGALHDGYVYVGKRKGEVAVITQKNREWLERLRSIIKQLESNSWIFRQRDIHVLETKLPELLKSIDVKSFDNKCSLAYVTGFFDAEGGVPHDTTKPLYIQFVQKKRQKLNDIVKILEENNVKCGKLHQYDKKSGCWRFFVRRESHRKFIELILSRHPEKQQRLFEFKNRLLERQTR
ncbi:MAG: LAGLIDADG family homing endonuclease [Candidatus Aenigmatarchaeota archaeon]